jgi:hypothetical protein
MNKQKGNTVSERGLNREICELIGAFIGDGYMGSYGKTKSHYVIGLAGDKLLDEEYFKEYLVPLIKRNFSFVNPKLRYRPDEGTLMLRLNSKKLFGFFVELGFKPGKKSDTVKIPEIITKDQELMNATLRGIFDTDGSIFFDKRKCYKQPYPRITLQSASIGLVGQIEKYLSARFKLYANKSNRDGYRNYVEIYGYQQLERFLKEIGFSNRRHLNKLVPL